MTTLPIWVVYNSPRDMPGWFVARQFEFDTPTNLFVRARTLDAVRELLPPGLTRLPRDPRDEQHILEIWL